MKAKQLKDAIESVLYKCNFKNADFIIDMILETACVESNCGQYIKQINGPACGIFQIEPKTAKDIKENFLKYRQEYLDIYNKLFIPFLSLEDNLMYNLAFQIFMCRMFYMRINKPIPKTRKERARYWKEFYNTKKGKGTTVDYLDKVRLYVD